MTTVLSQAYMPGSGPTAAYVQGYLSAFCAAMTDAGFPRTADTGQFDPATVVYSSMPTSGETVYEVRYLNDSLHSTYPVYVKISWIRSNSTPSYLRPNFRFGFATDGAGALTGSTSVVSPSPASSAGYCFIGAVSGPGHVGVFTDVNGALGTGAQSIGFLLTRTTDAAGSPTSEGIAVYTRSDSATAHVLRSRYLQETWANPTRPDYTFIPGSRTTSHDPGQSLNVYRHLVNVGQDMRVTPYAVSVHHSEVLPGVTFQADPIVGQNNTYMRIPWTYASANAGATTGMAVQWE